MAVITDQVKLNPLASGSAPTGVEGSIHYDSDNDALMSYGTAWQMVSRTTGTGGVETTYSGWKVHTFKSSGTFAVAGGVLTCDILVMGSGGSGGGGNASNYGSGAGAGGMLWRPGKTLSPGDYTITIGSPGSWTNAQTTGNKGADVVFTGNGYTLTGNGGGAGSGTSNSTQPAACTGGCGAGGGRDSGNQTPGQSNQSNSQDGSAYAYGYDGGIATGTGCTSAGGGGGTAQAGKNGGFDCQTARSGTQSEGGYGRNDLNGMSNADWKTWMWNAQVGTDTTANALGGVLLTSLGSMPSDIRLGGGGGGSYETTDVGELADGGIGGGGRGGSRYGSTGGTNALASTGSGGGAGQMHSSGNPGGNGASGVVVIKYIN